MHSETLRQFGDEGTQPFPSIEQRLQREPLLAMVTRFHLEMSAAPGEKFDKSVLHAGVSEQKNPTKDETAFNPLFVAGVADAGPRSTTSATDRAFTDRSLFRTAHGNELCFFISVRQRMP